MTQLLSFVLDAWKGLARPQLGEVEERITGRFFEHMVDEYPRQGLPLTIMPETPLYDPKTGIAYGRTDFRFLHREIPSQRIYLTVETKRLNIPQPSGRVKANLKAYVGPEGMERFVSGKYSAGLPEAAMLAYVMDGKIAIAANKISKVCASRAAQLCSIGKPVFRSHPVFVQPHGFSEHTRSAIHGGRIKLHHLFVAG